jgi:hypothetical protein
MEGTTKCRECGAEIIFIRLSSGKNMPVNAKPVWYWEYDDGESVVYQRDGRKTRCKLQGNEALRTGSGYVPHWGSCKGADKLRQREPPKRYESPATIALRERIAKEKAEREERVAKAQARAEEIERIRKAEAAQCSIFDR